MGLLLSPGGDMRQYRDAIASIESAGSGDYAAIGPTHDRLGRALGRYQIMEANIGPWSRAALGREVSPDEFLANPALQDQIFDHTFGGYIERFGPVGAAEAWFAGPGGVGKTERKDVLGTTVGDYGRKFSAALGMPSTVSTKSPSGGLLSEQEAPPMEQETAGGLLGRLFPDMGADRADELRLAINGMLHNPNQGRDVAIRARMGERAEGRKDAKAQAQAAQQANRTAQWLAGQPGGRPFAEAVASGALPAGEALRMWQAQGQGQEPTALMQNVEYIMRQNPDVPFNDALQMARSGQTINVNGQAPSPATGYRNVFDDQGRLIAQEPIPGGPVDREQQQAAQQQQQATQAQETQQQTTDNVVLNQVTAIRDMLNDGGMFDLPEAGILGNALGRMGVNQEAVNMRNRLATLEGMVSFDQLRQMREASPTGGALGAISERELTLLSAQLGTLDQSSDPQTIMETLDLLESVMRKADAYPNASEFGFGGNSQPSTPKIRTFNPATGRLE